MKYWFKIIASLLTLSSCSPQAKILTEKEFTQVYMDSLKEIHSNVNFKIAGDLTITSSFNGNEYKHFLDNAYKEYKLQPDSINTLIKRYINSSSELYQPAQGIQTERIVPIIKSIDYLDVLRQISRENGEEKEPWVVYEKYNDQLIIVYAEDTGNSISYFTKEDFNQLGIGRDTLLKFSIANLKRLLPDIQRIGEKHSFGIAAGGDFEASLILLPDFWKKENFDVDGDFVIAIPNRDLLFITGSNNLNEIETIKKSAEKSYKEGNYALSPYLYKRNGEKFEKYK